MLMGKHNQKEKELAGAERENAKLKTELDNK